MLCSVLPRQAAALDAGKAQGLADSRQLDIAASGIGDGDGSPARPFILRHGRDYALNRLIRDAASAARHVEVVFEDGVYPDVQIRIIRQGMDSDSVYSPDSPEQARCALGAGACRCNSAGGNCRVQAVDFTLDAHSRTSLTLRARHRGRAILDGDGLGRDDGRADATALTIAGSRFGVAPCPVS